MTKAVSHLINYKGSRYEKKVENERRRSDLAQGASVYATYGPVSVVLGGHFKTGQQVLA